MLRRAQNNFFVPTGAKSYAQPRCLFVRSISVWHILFRPRVPTIRCCYPHWELRRQDERTNCRARPRANVLRRQGCGRHRRAGVPPGSCPIPDNILFFIEIPPSDPDLANMYIRCFRILLNAMSFHSPVRFLLPVIITDFLSFDNALFGTKKCPRT